MGGERAGIESVSGASERIVKCRLQVLQVPAPADSHPPYVLSLAVEPTDFVEGKGKWWADHRIYNRVDPRKIADRYLSQEHQCQMEVFLVCEIAALRGIPDCLLMFHQSPTHGSGKIDGNEHTHGLVLLAQ